MKLIAACACIHCAKARFRLKNKSLFIGLPWQARRPVQTRPCLFSPSGIATYTQAGAQFGTGLLWTVFLSLPFMIAIELVSARIGRVTGKGVAANLFVNPASAPQDPSPLQAAQQTPPVPT